MTFDKQTCVKLARPPDTHPRLRNEGRWRWGIAGRVKKQNRAKRDRPAHFPSLPARAIARPAGCSKSASLTLPSLSLPKLREAPWERGAGRRLCLPSRACWKENMPSLFPPRATETEFRARAAFPRRVANFGNVRKLTSFRGVLVSIEQR